MATYLDRILAAHRAAAAVDERTVESVLSRLAGAPAVRPFRAALQAVPGGELAVISEVKRASPSRGPLRPDLDPAALARSYRDGGAACLSVLTDAEFFAGSPDDLRLARAAAGLPVLRKDFTVGPLDVLDARMMGADAVLLIVAALDDVELADLHALACDVGLDALVEVHDEAELDRALAVGATLVGVNQRDLVTFEVDVDRAARVARAMPDHVVAVAESGVRGPDDAARLAEAGYHAVLVGEALVGHDDPAAAVAALRTAPGGRPLGMTNRLRDRKRAMTDASSTDGSTSDGVGDGEPRHPIFALSDRFVDDFAALSPMTATYLGIGGADDRWDDTTPEGHAARADLFRSYQRDLAELAPPGDRWDALAMRILHEHLELSLQPLEHGDHLHELGHLQSLFPDLRDTFDLMDTATAEGWADIATRLASIGEPLAGLRACLDAGRARGLVAAQRQTRSIIAQLRASSAPDGSFPQLVGRHAEAAAADPAIAAAALDDRLRSALTAAADATTAMADWLESTYLPDAAPADGVGAERYRREARSFLGTDVDLAETYRWGWDHLLELRTEMERLAGEISPGRTLDQVVVDLSSDPTRSAASQDEFRAQMLERLGRAMADLDGRHFDIPDQIKAFDVRMAPRGAPLNAYFVAPSEDFSRPGTTWWSFGDQEVVPLWDQITTAYHEGFPGHHLQCGIQVWLADRLSRVHRSLFWLPGYGEGWALYAERLMGELGYFEKPEYELGMLAASALRAVRIPVDIGSHLDLAIPDDVGFHAGERWTFDLAVEALEHFAFVSHGEAVSEVTRYLGWPGQAIAYKLGERAILELREEVRAAEGDAFDLKAFHAKVLGLGPVGLDHLREQVLGS